MNSRTTVLLTALSGSVIGAIALINWSEGEPDNFVIAESADGNRELQAHSVASSGQIASSSDEADEADEGNGLMEELLSFLPKDTSDRTIVYAGGDLMEVEGLYIDEDAKSGFVTVIGLTKITLMDGRSLHVGGNDATMILDPTTGTGEVVAESITIVERQLSK